MAIEITIPGPIPSKKNSKRIIPGLKWPVPSKQYEKWERRLRNYFLRIPPVQGFIRIEIIFWWPDKRKCDLSNKAETVMDFLVEKKIIADDNWAVVPKLILTSGGIDRENPRAVVIFE